jgi:hypothetical protein
VLANQETIMKQAALLALRAARFHAIFLLGLLFYFEDGGDIFL